MSWSTSYTATSQTDLATQTQERVEQGTGAIPATVGHAITTSAKDIPIPDGKVIAVETSGHFDHGDGTNYNLTINVSLTDAPAGG